MIIHHARNKGLSKANLQKAQHRLECNVSGVGAVAQSFYAALCKVVCLPQAHHQEDPSARISVSHSECTQPAV